jgi:hypothetical protein
MLSTIQRTDK